MDILLDTHAVWWFLKGNDKMPSSVRNTIQNTENVIHVSVATIWEVAIKMSIGKLEFDGDIDGFIEAIEKEDFSLLNISPEHIKAVVSLPFIHRDPFDRMLIAQAMVEDIPIMTIDTNIVKYNIYPIW
ncbi:MAG: type II toxin-antitoxin system VapC family toxin [Defluviitaleaceae bacterium]|nr:type II toxin-antitoxin system VapC family toxin [Defluviitaleaceae bacterium]